MFTRKYLYKFNWAYFETRMLRISASHHYLMLAYSEVNFAVLKELILTEAQDCSTIYIMNCIGQYITLYSTYPYTSPML